MHDSHHPAVEEREHDRIPGAPPVAPGGIPLLGHVPMLVRNPFGFLASLSEQAEVVTIVVGRRPIYFVTSLELVRSILLTKSDAFCRGLIFEKAAKIFGAGVIVAEGEAHRRHRRLLQPAFQRRRIERYAVTMQEVIEHRTRSWRAGEPLQMYSETHRMMLEVLTHTMFGMQVGEPAAEAVSEAFPGVVAGMIAQALYPTAWLERLPLPVNRRYERSASRIRAVVAGIIDERRRAPAGDESLLGALLRDDGHGLTTQQLLDEMVTLLIAGTETTATTLAWLCHELATHPAVEQRLVDELSTGQGNPSAGLDDLGRLQYTDAVLTETLRLHAPNWLLTRTATHNVQLGRFEVPEGGETGFSLTLLHRDPAIFDRPLEFDPDRWMAEGAEDRHRPTLIPFGIGKHKCIGDVFAWTELTVAAASILRRWHLAAQPGSSVREVPWITVQPSGLVMVPQPRCRPAPEAARGTSGIA